MRYFQQVTLACALASLPVAGFCAEDDAVPLPPRPIVTEIAHAEIGRGLTFLGDVSSRSEANLAFPIPGIMVERLVDAGAVVDVDDALALLDPTDFTNALRRAEAAVIIATSRLRTVSDAADRSRTLVDRGVNSVQDLERAEQALAAAQATVDQANAAVVSARQNLEDTKLRAPRAGVVTATFADAGTQLTAGQPVLRLSGIQEREAVIDMTEDQLARFSIGDVFSLTLLANPEVRSSGLLASVDPVADATTRTRRVHLRIETLSPGFRLGALVEARPNSGAGIARLTIPAAALRADGTVWVVTRPANTVRSIPVTSGNTFGERIEILDGLAAGDEVVVKGVHSLSAGQAVGPRFVGREALE